MGRDDRPSEIAPDRLGKNIDASFSLRNRDAGLKPRQNVERIPPSIFQAVPTRRNLLLHREWNPNIGRFTHRGESPDVWIPLSMQKQVSHREWNPNIGRFTHRGAGEVASGHADDAVERRADGYGLADDRRVAGEAPRPPGIANHGDRLRAQWFVIQLRELPA